MANINVTPGQGQVGDTITVDGLGFLATHSVTITFGSTSEPNATTDSTGYFTTSFVVPSSGISSYGVVTITASDGTTSVTTTFSILSEDQLPEYCQAKDIADWLRIDINANTVPNKTQVNNYIIMNERTIDYQTGHSWLKNGQSYVHDQADIPIGAWHWSRGMPIYLKHRFVRQFDSSQGDRVEIWDGNVWKPQTIDANTFIYVDEQRGIMYIRGYLYSILTNSRFRVTYRYGGNNEGPDVVPKDIKKCCMLMTAIDVLSTDFKMSQVAYGGEGNVNKKDIIEKWQAIINQTIQSHSEMQTVW